MLGPVLCDPLTGASLLPKLRDHFAEFLDNASPAGLRIFSSSTCVGFRYGSIQIYSSFSWQWSYGLPYFFFSPLHALQFRLMVFPLKPFPRLHRAFLSRLPFLPLRPYSSVCMECRNLYLLSIGYAPKPRLRPRLPQGRSALPWNPWIFGRKDSHLPLATHSGILSSQHSTVPFSPASSS